MDRTLVNSSNVATIGYDPATLVLEVEFRNGGVYQYFDVPESVYQALMSSDSVGGFVNTVIKQGYRYART
jgi:hypothetical protein